LGKACSRFLFARFQLLIRIKVVYYGAGLSGKASNLRQIYLTARDYCDNAVTLIPSQTSDALFFDVLLPDNARVRSFKVRLHLYTVSGCFSQIPFSTDEAFRTVLKGVDAVVFVADSQAARINSNIESLRRLEQDLRFHGYTLNDMPYVLQLNKRDLPNALPVDNLKSQLGFRGEPVFESVANRGVGVMETFQAISNQILGELSNA
jgi:mutual gliding-motility protein MglA